MNLEIRVGEKAHNIELQRHASGWWVQIDGRLVEADARELSPGAYSILLGGRSYEVFLTRSAGGTLKLQCGNAEFAAEVIDPRAWRGRRHRALEAAGRQQIFAPMPGKIVRVLVHTGDKVKAGQGLIVVEAMKMQNEIKSPKSGVVGRLLAVEGQAVNAGETLAWVE